MRPDAHLCAHYPPHPPTTLAQADHWGVGLFRFFQLRQLPNFVLAAPPLVLCVCAVVAFQRRRGDWRTPIGMHLLHWLTLSVVCFVAANVQVTTRLVAAACAPYYWCMAYISRSSEYSPTIKWALAMHVLGYAICGTVAHANFLPFV